MVQLIVWGHPAERSLHFHIHSYPVAGVQKLLGRRIVGRADVVQVGFLHQPDILLSMPRSVGTTRERIDLMPAGSCELHLYTVDEKLPVLDLDLPEPDVPLYSFQ